MKNIKLFLLLAITGLQSSTLRPEQEMHQGSQKKHPIAVNDPKRFVKINKALDDLLDNINYEKIKLKEEYNTKIANLKAKLAISQGNTVAAQLEFDKQLSQIQIHFTTMLQQYDLQIKKFFEDHLIFSFQSIRYFSASQLLKIYMLLRNNNKEATVSYKSPQQLIEYVKSLERSTPKSSPPSSISHINT